MNKLLTAILIIFWFSPFLYAQQPRLMISTGHTDKILSAEFSNDGKRIVTTSLDRTVKLWDVQSSRLLKELKVENRYVEYAVFSEDDRKVLFASNTVFVDPNKIEGVVAWENKSKTNGYLFVWDFLANDKLDSFRINNYEGTKYMELAKDGQKILMQAGNNIRFNVFDCKQGSVQYSLNSLEVDKIFDGMEDQKTLKNPQELFNSIMNNPGSVFDKLMSAALSGVHFSPDGNKIIACCGKSVRIWNVKDGSLAREMMPGGYLNLARFDSTGKKIITGFKTESYGLKVQIWNSETGKPIDSLVSPQPSLNDLQISPDWKYLADMTTAWSLEKTGKTIRYPDSISFGSARFSRDNKRFVVYGGNNMYVYDLRRNRYSGGFSGSLVSANKLTLSPDGNTLLVSSNSGNSEVWDLASGRILFNDKQSTQHIEPSYTADSRYIVTHKRENTDVFDLKERRLASRVLYGVKSFVGSSNDRVIKTQLRDEKTMEIWDIKNNVLIQKVTTPFDFTIADFTSDEDIIIASQNYGYLGLGAINSQCIYLFNVKKNEIVQKIDSVSEVFYLSPDRKKVVVAKSNEDKSLSIIGYDITTGRFVVYDKKTDLNMGGYQYRANVKFSGDGKKIAVTTNKNAVLVFDAVSGKFLFECKDKEIAGNYRVAENDNKDFSPDGLFLKYYSKLSSNNPAARIKEKVIVYNTETGTQVLSLTGGEGLSNSTNFSTDGKIMAGRSDFSPPAIYDGNSGSRLFLLEKAEGAFQYALFSKDSKHAYCLNNNIIRIYQTTDGKLTGSLFCFNASNYLVHLPEGYYFGNKAALQAMYYVTNDLKIISFEQLDTRYNRPDLILQQLGNNDTALISAYRQAYYKRLKKLEVDSSTFHDKFIVPEADFVNRDQIEYEQKQAKLSLHIKGLDSYRLDRFNVWINEVPVFGHSGISIRKRNTKRFDTTIIVTLSNGENLIETSVLNVNGTESYRVPLSVKYTVQPKEETVYFIGIGINRFADSRNNLNWSVKDVRDLAISLKVKYGNRCTVDTLFEEKVTTERIAFLKKKLLQTGVNDKVMVAYSGHGLLSKDYDYYLSTYNVNFSKPEEGGLPYDVLESLLDSIPARKKLMLIDACHSGEVDKEEMLQYQRVQQQLDPTKKGVYLLVNKEAKRLGTKNSFELMQELFVNVGRSTGATIISAAAGTQFALERNNLQNGVFTYSILEYMKAHPHTNVSELKKYVNQRVPQLTQGVQVPTARSETNTVDWEVW